MKKIFLIIIGAIIFFISINFVSLNVSADQSVSFPVVTIDTHSILAKAYVPGSISYLTSMLNDTNAGNTAWFKTIYSLSRGILNVALFAFLVYVAFRNILNLGIDNYGIKRMLPKIIVAAFLGNLIRPIAAIASRIVDSLFVLKIFEPKVFDWVAIIGKMPEMKATGLGALIVTLLIAFLAPSGAAIGIGIGLLAFLVLGILLVMCLLVSLFLALRPWIVMLGVAVGPLAIAASVLPETESIFKRWLKIVGFWLVYPLIIYAIRYVAVAVPSMMGSVDDGAVSSAIGFIFPIIIKIILFFVAIRAPFAWEKDVGGFVENLPQTVTKGYQTVDKINRNVYGGIATKAYQAWRHGGRTAYNKGMEEYEPTANRIANRHLMQEEGQTQIRRGAIDILRSRIADDGDAMDALKGVIPNFANMQKMYEQYNRNPAAMAAGSDEEKAYKAFFDKDKAKNPDVLNESAMQVKAQKKAEVMLKAGQKAEEKWRNNSLTAKALMLPQVYSPSGLSTYISAWRENNASDMAKMEFRYNEFTGAVANVLGEETMLKNHVQRKKGDHQPLQSLEELLADSGFSIDQQAQIIGQQYGITNKREAKALLEAILDQLYKNQETGAVYAQMLLGKKGTINGKSVISDANMAGNVISAHEKARLLAATAARSTKSIEEQQYLRQNQMDRFYQATGGGSAALSHPGTSSQAGPVAVEDQKRQELTLADRKMLQALAGVEQAISGSSGVAAIDGVKQAIGGMDLRDIGTDQFFSLTYGAQGHKSALAGHLMEKAGEGKDDQVGEFMDALQASDGREAPILRERARQEFGDDPVISQLIVQYSAKRQLESHLASIHPEALEIGKRANKLVEDVQRDPRLLEQIRSAITTCSRDIEGDKSVSLGELKTAKLFIAKRVGISDPNSVTPKIVSSMSEVFNATTIRDPEVE